MLDMANERRCCEFTVVNDIPLRQSLAGMAIEMTCPSQQHFASAPKSSGKRPCLHETIGLTALILTRPSVGTLAAWQQKPVAARIPRACGPPPHHQH